MSFRPAILCHFCVRPVISAFCLGAWMVRASDPVSPAHQAVEFSDPKHDTLVTNVNQLEPENPRTQMLHESSSQSGSLTPQSPLAGELMAPTRISGVVINKRSKDTFDSLNMSSLNTPEEAMREALLKQFLSMPGSGNSQAKDKDKQQSGSTLESYYGQMLSRAESMAGGVPENANPWRSAYGQPGAASITESPSDNGNSLPVEETGSSLGGGALDVRNYPDSIWNPGLSSGDNNSGGLSSAFGRAVNRQLDETSPEAIRAKQVQDEQIQRFQAMLNGNYEPQPLSPPSGTSDGSGVTANPWVHNPITAAVAPETRDPFGVESGAFGHDFFGAPATLNPDLAPPSAPIAPAPASLSPTPYVPPPGRTPPPKPVFSIPQRAF